METQNELKGKEIKSLYQYLNRWKNEMVNVYEFNDFQKLTFKKFEVDLGFSSLTEYFYDDDNEDEVEVEDYEKYGLIDRKRFDVNELIEINDYWNSIEEIIKNVSSSSEFMMEIETMLKDYLEYYTNDLTTGEFILGDFVFDLIIDGVETEIED
jgi:hypothetical protein